MPVQKSLETYWIHHEVLFNRTHLEQQQQQQHTHTHTRETKKKKQKKRLDVKLISDTEILLNGFIIFNGFTWLDSFGEKKNWR